MHFIKPNIGLNAQHSAYFSVEKNVLIVHSVGHRQPGMVLEQSMCLFKRIEEESVRRGLNSVLVISEVTGRLSRQDCQNITEFINQLEFGGKLKLAMVSLDFSSYLDTIFAEQWAVKLNFHGRVFHDEGVARKWLALEG